MDNRIIFKLLQYYYIFFKGPIYCNLLAALLEQYAHFHHKPRNERYKFGGMHHPSSIIFIILPIQFSLRLYAGIMSAVKEAGICVEKKLEIRFFLREGNPSC